MDIPYNGNVSIRLIVKRFKNKVFYYVSEFNNYKYSLKPCMLSPVSILSFPFVRYFDSEMRIDKSCSNGASWKRLFCKLEDAEQEVKRLNDLYFNGFYHKPYLKIEKLEKNKKELLEIEKYITEGLKNFTNFQGIDFCDVSANGIQIRGHHKSITGYTYGKQITIKYDFSNYLECIEKFIDMWSEYDKPKKINSELDFIRDGEKYGWD